MINIFLIVLGCLVTIITNWFFLKTLLNLENRVKKLEEIISDINVAEIENKNVITEDGIARGLVRGLQELRNDDERHLKLLEMSRKLQNNPLSIMNQNDGTDRKINSGGNLIPHNLTQEEKEILNLFYQKSE